MIPEPVRFHAALKDNEPHAFAISTTGLSFGNVFLIKAQMLLLAGLSLGALLFWTSKDHSLAVSSIPPSWEKLNLNTKLPSGAKLDPHPNEGTLTKEEQTVTARPNGSRMTFISIPTDEP